MLNDQQILQDIHALPPEAQAEVLDFIAFIKQRKNKSAQSQVASQPFQIQPAERASGHQNTAADHDAVFAESVTPHS